VSIHAKINPSTVAASETVATHAGCNGFVIVCVVTVPAAAARKKMRVSGAACVCSAAGRILARGCQMKLGQGARPMLEGTEEGMHDEATKRNARRVKYGTHLFFLSSRDREIGHGERRTT
jgi:hypothetical protein